MLIRYSDGSYVEAAIYTLQGGRVRVAVLGCEVDFLLVEEEWLSRSGRSVTFEFPASDSGEAPRTMVAILGAAPGACALRGECVLRRISATSLWTN